MSVEIQQTLRSPRLPYERIADGILGRSYDLSLVICGDTIATRMNREYRGKTYRPNVLSFPLSKKEGEIFLNKAKAQREAQSMKTALTERLTYLFIHACLHLKGLPHGTRMDALEVSWMRKSGFPQFTLE